MKHKIYMRNFWTGETKFISTVANLFEACNICDKYNFDINRADYGKTYCFFEPGCRWTEAKKQLSQICK